MSPEAQGSEEMSLSLGPSGKIEKSDWPGQGDFTFSNANILYENEQK